MNSEILEALLKAATAAEQAGDFRLADKSDELAQRTAQLIKNVAEPALKYLGNDQAAAAVMAPIGNAIGGKGLSFDDALTDTPANMLGVGSGNYIQSYLTSPSAWLMDLIPATNRIRFMNMIRSELISSGFTELTDNRMWKAFAEQKGQKGLESLIRDFSQQADRVLGPVKNVADAESRLARMVQWVKNIPANKVIGMRQFLVRNIGSLAQSKGGFHLANERAQRATEYIKSKGVQNTNDILSTEELIKKNRLNLDDHGFDRTKMDVRPHKTKFTHSPRVKGVNAITGKVTSATDMVQSVAGNLQNNPSMMQKFLVRASGTKEGAKWLEFIRGAKDSTQVAKGLKILGKIAVIIAVADIIGSLPDAVQGDARAQVDVAINGAGLLFPPLAIANALASLFGIDLSDMLVNGAEVLGESLSGVDMNATTEGLINAGMNYNPQTKDWEDHGLVRSYNKESGKSFYVDMMNRVKSGMSINQSWLITLKKMKAAGATREEVLAVHLKYFQAKKMIYDNGMIGYTKAPMWNNNQIASFEQSLNRNLSSKLQSGVPYNDLLREIEVAMSKVPNLRMIGDIRARIVDNLNATQKNIINGETPATPQSPKSQAKVDNSLMSTAHRSRGPRVSVWQRFLAQNGFFDDYTQKTPPVFGPRTTRATRAFQAKYNLRVDGIVGPETLGKARSLGGKL